MFRLYLFQEITAVSLYFTPSTCERLQYTCSMSVVGRHVGMELIDLHFCYVIDVQCYRINTRTRNSQTSDSLSIRPTLFVVIGS
jgi:hypothetical protein